MDIAIGVGIVGAGGIFEQHAQALAELGGRARLTAVADVDPDRRERAVARHGVPVTCADHAELIARDDVELVVVCTPPALHEQPVADTLAAGKHVVCEKPLAHTLQAADRMIEAARRHPGRLSTVYQFRWLPEVRRTIWLRDSGSLGDLLFGRFSRFAHFRRPSKPGKPPKAPRPAWWGSWSVAGGGEVMTQLIHELDLACHVFGAPVEVVAAADTLKERIESDDTAAATIRFASGALASVFGTMCAHRTEAGFDVVGALGSAHAPWRFEALDAGHRAASRRAVLGAIPDETPPASAHEPYMRAVLDALASGAPLPIGPQDARLSLDLASGIYASALTGARVRLPLGPGDPAYVGVTPADYAGRVR